jgi:hypothetical protein
VQDRPTIDELLEAVAGFLHEEVMPNTTGRLSFHARVAGNVVQMLRRELEHREAHTLREWEGLDELLGREELPRAIDEQLAALERRNEKLCEMIRKGEADEEPICTKLHAHLRRVVLDKISVSDPRLVKEAAEEGD